MMDNKLSELSKPVVWEISNPGEGTYFIEHEPQAGDYRRDLIISQLYSQEYVSALTQRIAELEAETKVWESAAIKHLARAEEAEKRLPILEQDKLRLKEIINSEANRADEAEKLLATPVRLPKRWDVSGQVNPPRIVEVQFEQQNRTHDQCAKAIRDAGFIVVVEGDE
ncbi:hypothetical protein [Serratia marcescens]|uniref:hypothetical protein n=1 Tax=Serratia marcescens TaxID=615 RepID=UPI0034D7460B